MIALPYFPRNPLLHVFCRFLNSLNPLQSILYETARAANRGTPWRFFFASATSTTPPLWLCPVLRCHPEEALSADEGSRRGFVLGRASARFCGLFGCCAFLGATLGSPVATLRVARHSHLSQESCHHLNLSFRVRMRPASDEESAVRFAIALAVLAKNYSSKPKSCIIRLCKRKEGVHDGRKA